MLCRHCGQGKVSRPRKLCWNCYYAAGVRELYPRGSKYGIGAGQRKVRPALQPTRARPGSPEKIHVLADRAALGQELWHPHDATWEEETLPLGQAG